MVHTMDRPVREKKRTNHYDLAEEAAKQQWKKAKKTKKPEVKKPEGWLFVWWSWRTSPYLLLG